MTLMQQLIMWQQEQAQKEHLEPYMVLQFHTIKEIARVQPKTSMDLLHIKGIGPAKIRKYGDAILQLVRSASMGSASVAQDGSKDLFVEAQTVNDLAAQSTLPVHDATRYDAHTGEVLDAQDDIVSVTDFVTMMDTLLRTHFRSVRVQGEVVGFKRNASGHAYFEIKDRASVMRCMVFRDRYDVSGVMLADGMEIVITGYPNYHKQYGFGFVGTMVELFGEGAHKKAYDDLKKKFDEEGLFAPEKKRALPQLPQRIGLITSRTGAAIGDFTTNVGRYGYTIVFHQSRVEGAQAIDDLIEALTVMAQKNVDLLVIVRGGGSLESLQAFNHEKIVRMIAAFPVPVVAGVGHEQDETLTTLVADCGVSTPTAAARAVRESWDRCGELVRGHERDLIHLFDRSMHSVQGSIQDQERLLVDHVGQIVASVRALFQHFSLSAQRVMQEINRQEHALIVSQQLIVRSYERMLVHVRAIASMDRALILLRHSMTYITQHMHMWEKTMIQQDPRRHLVLGYSIVRDKNGHIVRARTDVTNGDQISIQVSDGEISAQVH